MADKYLKDRRTGDLYGWNFEMAKLPYMKVVERDEEGWDDGKPDLSFVDPEARALTPEVFPQSGAAAAELDADRQQVEAAALAEAAKKGREELDAPPDDAPPFDADGHMLLGYDEHDQPVYETDEERNERQAEERTEPEPELEAEPEPEEPPKKKKK